MLYRVVRKIPILSTIVKIINSYVYEGDLRAMDRFAPLNLWAKSVGLPVLVALMISVVLLHDSIIFPRISEFSASIRVGFLPLLTSLTPEFLPIAPPLNTPGALIATIYPNLLGFGIGVYALVFALAPKSLQFLQAHLNEQLNSRKRKQGSALMLNSSMAFPLLVIAISLIPAIFQQMKPLNQIMIAITWIVFWYGIVVLIELLGVLFSLGEQDTLDKLDS